MFLGTFRQVTKYQVKCCVQNLRIVNAGTNCTQSKAYAYSAKYLLSLETSRLTQVCAPCDLKFSQNIASIELQVSSLIQRLHQLIDKIVDPSACSYNKWRTKYFSIHKIKKEKNDNNQGSIIRNH